MTKSTLFVFMLCMPMLWAQHEFRAKFTPAENFEIACCFFAQSNPLRPFDSGSFSKILKLFCIKNRVASASPFTA